jgi:hypothetical protein
MITAPNMPGPIRPDTFLEYLVVSLAQSSSAIVEIGEQTENDNSFGVDDRCRLQ